MKTYRFRVTVVDTYRKEVEIEGDNLGEARKLLNEDLDECPIETRSNSLDYSDTSIEVLMNDEWEPIETINI